MSAHETRLYFLLQRTAHRLKVHADAALKDAAGLTSAQAGALSIIAADGPLSQKHLAQTLGQRESAITSMAARLAKANYITKITSPTDGRALELQVTGTGQAALEEVRRTFGQVNQLMDDAISEVEMKVLQTGLQGLLTKLEASAEGGGAA